MGSDLPWGSRSPHRFPIEGHGIFFISSQGGAHPARQRPFELVAGEAGKKPTIEGRCGAEMSTWSKQTLQEGVLLSAPLSNRLSRIAETLARLL